MDKFEDFSDAYRDLVETARKKFVGRRARIVSNFNGQSYGKSKKPMTGEVIEIENILIQERHVVVFARGISLGLHPYDIELL